MERTEQELVRIEKLDKIRDRHVIHIQKNMKEHID